MKVRFLKSLIPSFAIAPPIAWLWLSLAIVLEVIGTTALKASQNFTHLLPSLVMVVGYGLSLYMLTHAMRYMPVAVTYAFWSGLGIILIMIASIIIFKEIPDLPAIIGIALIIVGVVLISGFSQMNVHP